MQSQNFIFEEKPGSCSMQQLSSCFTDTNKSKKYTTAPAVSGKAMRLLINQQRQQEFQKKKLENGYRNNLFGRFIFLDPSTSLKLGLMSRYQMRFIKPTCCFYPMTVVTGMLSLWQMSLLALKKPNHLKASELQRCLRHFKGFTTEHLPIQKH